MTEKPLTKDAYQALLDRQRPRRSRPAHKESSIQQICVQWFRLAHPDKYRLLFAVPNGGFRIAREAARLYAEGVVAGVADILYIEPRGCYGSLAIEMKTPDKSSRQSAAQKEWQHDVEAVGVRYVVCRSLDDFRREVETYLAFEPLVEPRPDVEF